MQFYFIRHAQSSNNHLWDQTGSNRGRSEDAPLTPLGLLAAQFSLAVILVTHFNKSFNAESIQRTGGAMGMVGAVRIVWSFSEDPDTGTRQMLPEAPQVHHIVPDAVMRGHLAGGVEFAGVPLPVMHRHRLDTVTVGQGLSGQHG